jgi:hypothetical protein
VVQYEDLPSLFAVKAWGKSRTKMREQTQFVAFWEYVNELKPKFLNNFRIRSQGTKNADKTTAIIVESIF